MKSLIIIINPWTGQVSLIFHRTKQRPTTYHRNLIYLVMRAQQWIRRFYRNKSYTIRPYLGLGFGIVIEEVT